jgi:hypothetical protein
MELQAHKPNEEGPLGSWTHIDPQEFALEVKGSPLGHSSLLLEDRSAQVLREEKVLAKAHALTSQCISDDVGSGVSGTLFLTNYRVMFQPFANAGAGKRAEYMLELPCCSIASVKVESSYDYSHVLYVLEIDTKDFRCANLHPEKSTH